MPSQSTSIIFDRGVPVGVSPIFQTVNKGLRQYVQAVSQLLHPTLDRPWKNL